MTSLTGVPLGDAIIKYLDLIEEARSSYHNSEQWREDGRMGEEKTYDDLLFDAKVNLINEALKLHKECEELKQLHVRENE